MTERKQSFAPKGTYPWNPNFGMKQLLRKNALSVVPDRTDVQRKAVVF